MIAARAFSASGFGVLGSAGFNTINAFANGLHDRFPMIEASAQYL